MADPPGEAPSGAAREGTASEPRGLHAVTGPGRAGLARLCERWETSMPSHEVGLPTLVRLELPTTLARGDWRPLVEVHPREVPPELTRDLRELTPQALLRDLHRPVRQFFVELQPVEGTRVSGRLEEEFDLLRKARQVEGRPQLEPSVRVVHEEQLRRQALMAEEWKPLVPDDAPRAKVEVWAQAAMEEEEREAAAYRPDFSKYRRERDR